ncbi:lipid-binding protein [Pedobacter panaciterrae]|uniref:Lipid-binding protein n=1 Tax=Pedobacter panaciterrae TaxID=363849 RepID=A0ABU8NRN3_9SPHI|nr:lipid-binding protein [uncultured Pedobacter sp.]
MKINNNKILTLMLMVIAAVYATSCKKDVDYGGTVMQKMSGDWHVSVDNSAKRYNLYSFNTADNSAKQFWIQSTGLRAGTKNIAIKGKINVDLGSQTFSVSNVTNVAVGAPYTSFSISNGRIITNGTVGPGSGTPTDSITFDLNIDGATFKVTGRHKTGFVEDRPK